MFSFVLFFCFYFIFYFFHFLFCSLHSSCVLCNLCCQFLWIFYSWLNLRFSLTFIYRFISNWIYYYCHTFHKISFVQWAVVIVWQLDWQQPMQSVPITIKVVRLNPVHGEVYLIQHYVIKFVSYLRQDGGFLRHSGFLHQ